jgi:hypothetical protein
MKAPTAEIYEVGVCYNSIRISPHLQQQKQFPSKAGEPPFSPYKWQSTRQQIPLKFFFPTENRI